jgi:uncharacterized protein YndB with AHSA1/START domain
MSHTTRDAQDLVVTRVFAAPLEEVWKVWVDPELVEQWWGPYGFTAPVARMDFREGGTSLVCMRSAQYGYGDQYSTWHCLEQCLDKMAAIFVRA